MRLPLTRRPVAQRSAGTLRGARVRLTLYFTIVLGIVAVVAIGALYVALTPALEVETATESITSGAGEVLIVDVQTEQFVSERVLERLRVVAMLTFLGLFVGSVVAAWFIAGRVLRPVEQAWRAQRQFIQDTSHELRNPLAAMCTSLDLALESPMTSSDQWRELGGGLRESVDRLARVVDSMLGAARDEIPQRYRDMATIDPADVMHRVARAHRGTGVTLDVTAESARVTADAGALERAVANLVDNAVRYAPSGPVIEMCGARSADGYDMWITDAGPGINEEDRDRVFERGYRSADSPGLGLGLAISRDIVRAHGGDIAIERTGLDGTSIRLRLPSGR